MNFFNLSFWQNFVSNFVSSGLATLLGVIIGIPVALWLNSFQTRRTEKEKKKKILASLVNELGDNKHELERMNDNAILRSELYLLGSRLRNELWKAYSDGGELQWIKDIELLGKIADSYYSIRAIMELADKHYSSVYSTIGVVTMIKEGVIQESEDMIDLGLKTIKNTMEEINQQLSKPKNRLSKYLSSYKKHLLTFLF